MNTKEKDLLVWSNPLRPSPTSHPLALPLLLDRPFRTVTSAFPSKLNKDVQTYFCVSLTIPHFGVQVFNRQFIASPCDFIFLRLSSTHLQIAVYLKVFKVRCEEDRCEYIQGPEKQILLFIPWIINTLFLPSFLPGTLSQKSHIERK